VPDWTTMVEHSVIPGHFPDNEVPAALGGKTIHPFSDFLLHDIGTGDGIVQTQHAQLPPTSARDVNRIAPLGAQRLLEQVKTPADRQAQLKTRLEKVLQEARIVRLLSDPNKISRTAD